MSPRRFCQEKYSYPTSPKSPKSTFRFDHGGLRKFNQTSGTSFLKNLATTADSKMLMTQKNETSFNFFTPNLSPSNRLSEMNETFSSSKL